MAERPRIENRGDCLLILPGVDPGSRKQEHREHPMMARFELLPASYLLIIGRILLIRSSPTLFLTLSQERSIT